jgi:uncharacterized protein (DUF362 family)
MKIDHANLTKIKFKPTFDVSLASEEDRYQTVFKSLEFISKDINNLVGQLKPGNDYILLKPNCVVDDVKNCATNIDALKATLDFLTSLWPGKIIFAEGSSRNTFKAFENYGYNILKQRYENIEFLDLNYSDAIFVDIFDKNLRPQQIRISNTVAEAPLRISVGPPKTHDSVIVTLSIKNMAVGSILGEEKNVIHQGPIAINKSIAKLFEYTFPHLAIIDGWQGMEGNGPVRGKMVETKFAIASLNALAADMLATRLMGFNPLQIGYLSHLGAFEVQDQIHVLGKDPADFSFKFKPHDTYLEQIQWSK